jgi:hypothetical protein
MVFMFFCVFRLMKTPRLYLLAPDGISTTDERYVHPMNRNFNSYHFYGLDFS